jgi:hypothetical protein
MIAGAAKNRVEPRSRRPGAVREGTTNMTADLTEPRPSRARPLVSSRRSKSQHDDHGPRVGCLPNGRLHALHGCVSSLVYSDSRLHAPRPKGELAVLSICSEHALSIAPQMVMFHHCTGGEALPLSTTRTPWSPS